MRERAKELQKERLEAARRGGPRSQMSFGKLTSERPIQRKGGTEVQNGVSLKSHLSRHSLPTKLFQPFLPYDDKLSKLNLGISNRQVAAEGLAAPP